MGEEGARERAMAAAQKRADKLLESGKALRGAGIALAFAGGAVGAYGEYEQTHGNLTKAFAVGVGDVMANFGGGYAGSLAASLTIRVADMASGALSGAEDGMSAGPDGAAAGAVVGGIVGAGASLLGGNLISNFINNP